MITAIGTNVLIDVLLPGGAQRETSMLDLQVAARQGPLIISEAVFAELGAGLRAPESLDSVLGDFGIDLVPSNRAALHRARASHGAPSPKGGYQALLIRIVA